MEYVAQFIVMFALAWAATYSLRIYMTISMALIGWIFIPLIAVILIIGEGAGWYYIGYALLNLLTLITDGFKTIPIILGGTTLGILYGLGIRP